MSKVRICALGFFLTTACSSPPAKQESPNRLGTSAQSCAISPREEELLLQQDYLEFDESVGNGGWRYFPSKCCLSAANLIGKYRLRHQKLLKPYQSRVLGFHAGQLLIKAGENKAGLQEIKNSYASYLPKNDEWNLFVSGTVAFLEKDLSRLKAIRAEYLALRGEKSSKPYGMDPVEYLIRDLVAGEDYGHCD